MACDVFYIIGKLLELRCLKWARVAHLDIRNTNYGPKKVENRPDLLVSRRCATYHSKALDENYNFALNRILI